MRGFRIEAPDEQLDDLHARLRRTRWPEPATVDDWSQGVPLPYLQELCRYWLEVYDWRTREARINAFSQTVIEVGGVDIHAVHVRSPEPDALPLVLTHGWPGSFVEFLDVIAPLADPGAHGADRATAFHVVVPSLPGYGWSGKPSRVGWGVQRTADAWVELMAQLGYDRFGAQGGDWGAGVSTCLAQQHPDRVVGIHLNLPRGAPDPEAKLSADEQALLASRRERAKWEYGYAEQQTTRPQTLGYGLTDSPAGQCAWILEKFRAWTDCDGDPVAAFGADRILDNVMAYWLPAAAASSARMYWESFRSLWPGEVDIPVGVSVFPKEIVQVPRHWAERNYRDLRYWHEVDRGGHFAAFEQPAIFVDEVRAFFSLVR
jgi:pimeloyl-ACP methyl ester carboxylesterase